MGEIGRSGVLVRVWNAEVGVWGLFGFGRGLWVCCMASILIVRLVFVIMVYWHVLLGVCRMPRIVQIDYIQNKQSQVHRTVALLHLLQRQAHQCPNPIQARSKPQYLT